MSCFGVLTLRPTRVDTLLSHSFFFRQLFFCFFPPAFWAGRIQRDGPAAATLDDAVAVGCLNGIIGVPEVFQHCGYAVHDVHGMMP